MKKNQNFFTKKNLSIIAGVIILGIIAFLYFRGGNNTSQTLAAHSGDFLQQVSVSGKVVATSDLNLSFEQAGRVTSVPVKVGDSVKQGDLLISQDVSELSAKYREMQAGIEIARAKQAQLLSGSSPEEIAIAETGVSTAKQKLVNTIQDVEVKIDDAVRNHADRLFQQNGSQFIFGITFVKSDINYNITTNDASLKALINEGRQNIQVALTKWPVVSMSSSDTLIEDAAAYAQKNLFTTRDMLSNIQLALNSLNVSDSNTSAVYEDFKASISTGRLTVSTALSSLVTATSDFHSAQSELVLKKAPVRSADASLYEAQIAQSEAQAESILAQLGKKQIHAPLDGVVTVVNPEVGTTVSPTDVVVSMISSGTLQIESYIPEKNIPFVKLGDDADVTLDAYGDNTVFKAKVISIDPAETIRDGVSTYRVKLQFPSFDDRIKSGMTANVLITTLKKSNVISVPLGSVYAKNTEMYVDVKEGGNITTRKVETGSLSSLGQLEITSGLRDGDVVLLDPVLK